jgi:hypothetical protein
MTGHALGEQEGTDFLLEVVGIGLGGDGRADDGRGHENDQESLRRDAAVGCHELFSLGASGPLQRTDSQSWLPGLKSQGFAISRLAKGETR